MYIVHEVYQAERGKAPEIVAAFRMMDQAFQIAGYANRRIYVDYTGTMDTVVYQYEVDSLDQYFSTERGLFVDPDADAQAFMGSLNNNATLGYEIYEVVQ